MSVSHKFGKSVKKNLYPKIYNIYMLFNIYGVIIGRGSFYSISEVVYVKKKKKKKEKKKRKRKEKVK